MGIVHHGTYISYFEVGRVELGNGGEELVAEGYTTLACVGHDHVIRRVPSDAEAILRGPELTESRPEPEVSQSDRRAYEGVVPSSS